MNWEEQLGLKFSAFVAGIVGGIISLTYENKLSFIRALTLIIVGGVTAGYGFVAIDLYFKLSHQWAGFFGFLIGLISMRLVDSVIGLANLVRQNPAIILSLLRITSGAKNGNITSNNSNTGGDSSSVHSSGEGRSETGLPN